jgi:copper transport protein
MDERWPGWVIATRVAGVVLGAAALLALLPAGPAHAHAVLQDATPSDRSVLDEPPDEVLLRFNEPVDLPTGGLRVFDTDANRVDTGTLDLGDRASVGVGLPGDLPDGGYVVTWRVISADSHPISGVLTFTVGDGPAVDDALVAELFAGGDGLTSVLGPALRGVGYVAVLLAAGALYLAVAGGQRAVLRRDDDRRRARRLARLGAIAGIWATILAVPVQTAAVTGEGPLAVFRPVLLGEVLTSSFGQGTLVRLVWLLALLVFLSRRAPLPASAIAATAALLSFLLDGHQRSAEPTWLLMLADGIHLAAGALWFGGLVVLAWAVRSRSIDDDPVGAARLVARFSSVALLSVAAVAVAGGAMTWALVRAPRALTTTTYGWLLVAKVAVVLLVVLVAFYNRARLVPAVAARHRDAPPVDGPTDPGGEHRGSTVPAGPHSATATATNDNVPVAADNSPATTDHAPATTDNAPAVRRSRAAWRQLRSTLVVEAALLVVVLGITGVLVTTQPAAEAAGVTGAVQVVTPLTDELDVEVIVDPNEVGLNALHIYVLDTTGRPAEDVDDLTLELTYVPEDVGPFRIEPFFVGTGHWTANVDTLRFAGEWQIDVVAGIDRFTEARATITVVVNP